MFVILAEPEDTLALCVHAELERRHGAGALLLASAAELSCAQRFSYCDGGDAATASRIELAGGRSLDAAAITALWCRLRWLALPQFAASDPADLEYAQIETFALLLAWLAALPCPVVVPPDPRGLAGAPSNRWQIARAAALAGLAPRAAIATTSPRRRPPGELGRPSRFETSAVRLVGERAYTALSPATRHQLGDAPALFLERLGDERAIAVVIGDRVLGDTPAELATPLRRFARALGTPLLEVRLGVAATDGAPRATAPPSAWRVDDATSFVTALRGDVVEAIADSMEGACRAREEGAAESIISAGGDRVGATP